MAIEINEFIGSNNIKKVNEKKNCGKSSSKGGKKTSSSTKKGGCKK